MKNVSFVVVIFLFFAEACSKKEPVELVSMQSSKPNYDTTAIDSFSNGAISVDIARKIRMSSKQYQDSLKEALKIEQEEKRIKEEVEKENKKKAEEDKKLKEKPVSSETKID